MRVTMEGCAFRDAMASTANAYQVSLGQDVKVSDAEAKRLTLLSCGRQRAFGSDELSLTTMKKKKSYKIKF